MNTAIRRLGPPAAELLPAAGLGDPDPRHAAARRVCRRRVLPVGRHDTEQPEEGSQGQGGGEEEGLGGGVVKGGRW